MGGCYKEKENKCVTINVFTTCDECHKKQGCGHSVYSDGCYHREEQCQEHGEDTCVELNIFTECNKKNHKPLCQ